ncbi:hypothetical protein E2C01_053656 [Portunus trituberculatus]|uniref:Uncharacterized protein n=1 Tax=Portunus trituberculatus TaxID=210409 RepID=A0A5B7GPY7_PORTR|nr:hypothetical protein [Portunus trituberculatus]
MIAVPTNPALVDDQSGLTVTPRLLVQPGQIRTLEREEKEYSPARNRGAERALRVPISVRLSDRWNMQGVHRLEVTESPSRECDREKYVMRSRQVASPSSLLHRFLLLSLPSPHPLHRLALYLGPC